MKVAFVTDVLSERFPNGWLEVVPSPTHIAHDVIRKGIEMGFLKPRDKAYIAQFGIAGDGEHLMEELKEIKFDHVVVIVQEDEQSQERARVLSDLFVGKLTVLFGSDWSKLGIIAIVGEATLIQCNDDEVTPSMEALLRHFLATGELLTPVTA